MEDIELIAKQVGIELTPELRELAWAIKHNALIAFFKAAKTQLEYQQKSWDAYMKEKDT
jgi:hypothetical protein